MQDYRLSGRPVAPGQEHSDEHHLRLDASIRQEGSVTRAVADTLESTIAAELGSTDVVRRDIGTNPLDGSVWASAAFSGFTPEEARTDEQKAASALGAELADELVAADALIFAVPMYNFGVSQHFKTWYDMVATDPRFAPGAQTIAVKPAFLVTARGGGYGAGTPREGWDHATGWMRRVLEDVWGLDLDVIETELTLAEVQPQMAELRDLARSLLARFSRGCPTERPFGHAQVAFRGVAQARS